MAHDRQYKAPVDVVCVSRYDYPKEGEAYWDKYTHRIVVAEEDVGEKCCIVERGD